jgi:hypothetical protein
MRSRTREIWSSEMPRSRATRSRRLPSKSSSPRMARSVTSATWSRTCA